MLAGSQGATEALPREVSPETAKSAAARRADLAMDRYADGEDAAFKEVFDELAPRVHSFLRRLTGSEDAARDLAQETFLRMHRARGSFARGHAVLPWAYAIARNCFTSQVRSPAHRARRASVDAGVSDVATGADASAEETFAARESAEIVAGALGGMSALNREAFVLLRFEGLSVAEAAQIVGATESTVKVRAFRAYEILRDALKRAGALSGASSAAARNS
jgi:RNA polymerase sigma-70 factor (ECF subfamily)